MTTDISQLQMLPEEEPAAAEAGVTACGVTCPLFTSDSVPTMGC